MSIAVVAAVAAVAVSVGTMAYGMATAPGTPQLQAPPPPANSVQYDDEGNVVSSQYFDSATNTWVSKGKELSPEEKEAYKADKAKLKELRTKMLDNLNTTPEDRQKAYEEYQQAYSDAAHRDVDPRFEQISRTADEQANATGMYGSRAYVDTKSELAKDKLAQDADIANQAVLAKENLASNDRNYYANMLAQIDAGARADSLSAAQIAKSTSDIGSQKYADALGSVNMQNSNIMAKWQAEQAKSSSYIKSGSNMAGGLMYLYGNKTGGSGINSSNMGSGSVGTTTGY